MSQRPAKLTPLEKKLLAALQKLTREDEPIVLIQRALRESQKRRKK